MGLAPLDAVEEKAGILAAVALEHLAAQHPQGVLAPPAGDHLGRTVERGDPSPMVDGEDPVRHMLEDEVAVPGVDLGTVVHDYIV